MPDVPPRSTVVASARSSTRPAGMIRWAGPEWSRFALRGSHLRFAPAAGSSSVAPDRSTGRGRDAGAAEGQERQ